MVLNDAEWKLIFQIYQETIIPFFKIQINDNFWQHHAFGLKIKYSYLF